VLDGDFDEVSIEVSDVTVEVTDGKVGKMTVADSAYYTQVNVATGATVNTLTLNAKTEVKGQGTVKEAFINADGVVIEKAPEKYTVASDISVEPVIAGKTVAPGTTNTTTPSGGSGSVPSTPTITLSGFALIDKDGGVRGLDLSGETDTSIRIEKFRATSNAATTEATIESITSPKTGTITIGVKRVIDSATKDIAVSDIWPPYMGERESMSIGGLREVFGSSVTVTVTLRGTGNYAGYAPATFNIEVKLANDNTGTLPYIKDWATFSYNASTKTVTATVKADKQNNKFSDYKDRALQMFLGMADILNEFTGNEDGFSNLSISLDGGSESYNNANDQTQRTKLKEELRDKWDLDLDSATLASLNGKRLICKYKNNPTTYYVNIIIAQ
jgi:hypothetical protein